jgi:hypothetical protein
VVTRPRDCSWVTSKFENLAAQDFTCSSDPDDDYNCIAWAAGKTDNYWWPTTLWPFYWPKGLPTFPNKPNDIAESVDNFIAAFEREGYKVCKNGRFHPRYEKVAIYANKLGRVKHAARLLTTGAWSSKLGEHEDIEHKTSECIEGKSYGYVKVFLRRRIPKCQRPSRLTRFRSFLSRAFGRSQRAFSLTQSENPISS